MVSLDELAGMEFPLSYEQEMSVYNGQLDEILKDGFRSLNHFVMDNTQRLCEAIPELYQAVQSSISAQYIVFENGSDDKGKGSDGPSENIVVSRKRSFEAASAYKGKKIAVLNFANNHSVGGSPWSAGAQEECLCRISTLYPCIHAEYEARKKVLAPFNAALNEIFAQGVPEEEIEECLHQKGLIKGSKYRKITYDLIEILSYDVTAEVFPKITLEQHNDSAPLKNITDYELTLSLDSIPRKAIFTKEG